MSSSQAIDLSVDVAIFGGGIAGLWLLATLRNNGFNAVLFEADEISAGQTRYAQGIIHGGTKYTLTGSLSASAQAVAAMPGFWQDCLQGRGALDLQDVKVLSDHQFMWSTSGLTSKMAGFFASRVMRSRTVEVKANDRPQAFQNKAFKGHVYRLNEPVVDTSSLVKVLSGPHAEAIFSFDWAQGVQLQNQNATRFTLASEQHGAINVETAVSVFTAGKGNESLLQAFNRLGPAMQIRPLVMVMIRGGLPGPLYAHCLGASMNPRITITSHYDAQGDLVWYVGGQLAEDGPKRSTAEQISVAKQEMNALFPWLDFSKVQWGTLAIDRAEPKQADGSRPEGVYAHYDNNIITAWPTKLALAPKLTEAIVQLLQRHNIKPGEAKSLPDWPHPDLAALPWQEESRWNNDT